MANPEIVMTGKGRLTRYLLRAVWAVAIITATIVVIRAFDARSLPDLHAWHEIRFDNEFDADRDTDVDTFTDYVALEETVFDELDEKILGNTSGDRVTGANRFDADSVYSSRNHDIDWNRTIELVPMQPRGTVLMLHGLTDSPYSMRSTAELFFAQGYHVLVPRLPGHGTAPGGLLQAHWEDWQAVTKMGATHLRSGVDADLPFVIVGYSNGGALAVNYALDTLQDDRLPRPDRLILMSPAIGLTPFAFFASWNRTMSWIPYFEKFAWESVLPEYDPYKFNSFPKAAGNETYELAKRVQKRLARLQSSDDLARMPPLLVFAPLVDSTVRTEATADHLFVGLNRSQDELVLYDINRIEDMAQFFRSEYKNLLQRLQTNEGRQFRLTILRNRSSETQTVVVTSSQDNRSTTETIDADWPLGIYSMSHVAVPFPATDSWYGDGRSPADDHVSLGRLNAYGEKNLLTVSPAQILRLRYNPFYDYQARRIDELLND
jgi:alpha-beta hydrolase superfamily lysophospholipase